MILEKSFTTENINVHDELITEAKNSFFVYHNALQVGMFPAEFESRVNTDTLLSQYSRTLFQDKNPVWFQNITYTDPFYLNEVKQAVLELNVSFVNGSQLMETVGIWDEILKSHRFNIGIFKPLDEPLDPTSNLVYDIWFRIFNLKNHLFKTLPTLKVEPPRVLQESHPLKKADLFTPDSFLENWGDGPVMTEKQVIMRILKCRMPTRKI